LGFILSQYEVTSYGRLLREVHAAQEGLAARVGAQGLESRVKTVLRRAKIVHPETFLEPREGLGFFPGHHIQPRNVTKERISLASPRSQLVIAPG
jgi:hypothetical protein